jgi:hypothetical protein
MYFILCIEYVTDSVSYRIIESPCGCLGKQLYCTSHRNTTIYKDESYPFLWDFLLTPSCLDKLLKDSPHIE